MEAVFNVSPDVLGWVREKAGNASLESLSLLESWIDGEKVPTFNQIETVSRETRIPLGYFFLNEPPKENIPLLKFRTVNNERYSEPSRNLEDTILRMEMIAGWMRETLKDDGREPCPVAGSIACVDNPSSVAEYVRSVLHLVDNPVSPEEAFEDIRERISRTGITVMQGGNGVGRPLNAEEVRAFTIIDDYAPLIFINAASSPEVQLYSLLHEFIHVCLGVPCFYNGENPSAGGTEKLCHDSISILLPGGFLTLEETAREIPAESGIDRRFLNMLTSSVREGKTEYCEACRLAGMDRIAFSRLF